MLRLVPAYTLEALDGCDTERLLPYYFWDYRKTSKLNTSQEQDNIVYRDGKPYKKVKAKDAEWLKNIF